MKNSKRLCILLVLLCCMNLISCKGEFSFTNKEDIKVANTNLTPTQKIHIQTDLKTLINLTTEEFMEKTQFNVALRHYDTYDYYYDLGDSYGWLDKENKIINFWCNEELENYTFYGIQVGMEFSEACKVLEEQGFTVQDSNEVVAETEKVDDVEKSVYIIDPTEDKKLTIREKFDKVYSYEYCEKEGSLSEPIAYKQESENDVYSIEKRNASLTSQQQNIDIQINYPKIIVKSDSFITEQIDEIFFNIIDDLEDDYIGGKDGNRKISLDYMITYETDEIVSLCFYGEKNYGEVIPLGFGITINISTGELLSFDDLGIDKQSLKDDMEVFINEDTNENFINYISNINGRETNFYIAEKELAVFFYPTGDENYYIKTFDVSFSKWETVVKSNVNKDVIDLYNYVDLQVEEFNKRTGFHLVEGETDDFPNSYSSRDGRLQIYFDEDGIGFLDSFVEAQGYTFRGIYIGMTEGEMLNLFKEKEYMYTHEYDDSYELYFKNNSERVLIIYIENDTVSTMQYYSWSD